MRSFLLCLVLDEEDLRLADLLGRRLFNGRLQIDGIGLLGQHVDDGLLLDRRLLDAQCRLADGGRGSLDEHNAVVFAWRRHGQLWLRVTFLGIIYRWHMHIDVLRDERGAGTGIVGLLLELLLGKGIEGEVLLGQQLLLLLWEHQLVLLLREHLLLLLLWDQLLLLLKDGLSLRGLPEDLLQLRGLQRLLHNALFIQAGRDARQLQLTRLIVVSLWRRHGQAEQARNLPKMKRRLKSTLDAVPLTHWKLTINARISVCERRLQTETED